MLGLLLLSLFPLALFGGFGGGDDGDVAQDDTPAGDDSLPGSGGTDIFNPGSGGGTAGGGSSGGGTSGGGFVDTYDKLQRGTDASDTLTGGAQADLLIAGGAEDSLTGGSQADYLYGFGGNDTLRGDGGDDTLSGGAGNDTIWGQDNDDLLAGNGGDDLLQGGSGADVLIDFSGSDTLKGGTGGDRLIALDLTDKISSEDAMVRTGDIQLAEVFYRQDIAGYVLDPDYRVGDDLALFQELHGGERTDNTPDILDGGSGNDTLLGDNGDTLTGGAGSDLFIGYTDPSQAQSYDPIIIADFDRDTDRLQILVEDNGKGAVTMAAAPDGAGTQIFYRDDVVALILGKTPGDLSMLLTSVVTRDDV